jgi:hypothetical protein
MCSRHLPGSWDPLCRSTGLTNFLRSRGTDRGRWGPSIAQGSRELGTNDEPKHLRAVGTGEFECGGAGPPELLELPASCGFIGDLQSVPLVFVQRVQTYEIEAAVRYLFLAPVFFLQSLRPDRDR